jgi:hypothetical protein
VDVNHAVLQVDVDPHQVQSEDTEDLGDRLRRIGFRARKDALAAFLAHAHKSRVGPTETVEQLADLEERARAAVNLARRRCTSLAR